MTLVWALCSQASVSLSVQWGWQLPSPCAPVPHGGQFLRAAARGLWASLGEQREGDTPDCEKGETGFGRSQAVGDETDK